MPTGNNNEAATGNINGSEKEKSHFRACETPSALRATSPARRRCLPPDGQAMGSRAFDHKRISFSCYSETELIGKS